MLRDQQKKLELAGRMRQLWEASAVTQEHVADYIGLKHRSYQKALQTGGISYEKLRKLAEFHDVDFDWLVKGDNPQPTPDLLGVNGPEEDSQLDRIEEMLTMIVNALGLQDEAPRTPKTPLPDLPEYRPEPGSSDEATG